MENNGDHPQPPPPGDKDEFHDAEHVAPSQQNVLNAGAQPFPWPPGFWPPGAWPPQWPPQWMQAPQQQPHALEPRTDRVKLGEFFRSHPSTRFNLAEASCRRNYVVDARDKYDVVLSSLPDEVIKKLGPLADGPQGYNNPYTKLKTRVLELYAPTVWEDLDSLLH